MENTVEGAVHICASPPKQVFADGREYQTEHKVCARCRKSFVGIARAKYCSDTCRDRAEHDRERGRRGAPRDCHPATCETCDRLFLAAKHNQRYCCAKCQWTAANQRNREKRLGAA